MSRGKVYLVGAGPGDPKLLTIRAYELIRSADIVVYDRLVSQPILGLIPNNVEKLYVGKTPECKGGILQAEINVTLIHQAMDGKMVVRLKGGDPLIFSRGGEEAEALRKAGVPFELVPGISSAIAAPAYAGIPITHRGYSSSVAIVTGHEDPSKARSRVDWGKLASSVDTIVILMGVRRLRKIAEELMRAGLEGSRPIAVIQSATTANQKTLIFSLEQAAQGLLEEKIEPPSLIVVGEVVALARSLRWNDSPFADYLSLVTIRVAT